MTIREIHNEVGLQLQQLAANRTRKYQPDEIDLVLNKIQKRFIQSKLKRRQDGSGGFELEQIDADSIRTLIVPSYDMVPYIEPGENRYKCLLPPDYSYLLSDWSYTTQQCLLDDKGNLVPPEVASQSVYIHALRQDYTSKGSALYYVTLAVTLGGSTVNLATDLPYGNTYSGLVRKEDISLIIPFIALTGKWYWEQFENLRYPGYYIDVATSAPPGGDQVVQDGVTFAIKKTAQQDYTYHPGTGQYFDNRLTASNRISGLNSTAFYKSSYYSPVSELGNNVLYVYNDNSFTVNKVSISYIRKPLPISLPLNLSSELPEEFHQNLCDLVVEYILSTIKDEQGTKMKQENNITRVVL